MAERIDDTIPTGSLACWNLELLETAGTPASFLTILGISPDWSDDETFARFEVEGHEQWVPVYLELLGGGEAEFVMPLHPDDHMNGGAGQLVVYNEATGVECAPIRLFVEPLIPAPGTLESIVDHLETTLTANAAALGFDTSELMTADPKQLPPFVNVLAANLQLLAGDGPDSIRGLLQHRQFQADGETYSFDDDALDLVDALFYSTGLDEQLYEWTDGFSLEQYGAQGQLMSQPYRAMAASTSSNMVLPHNIKTPGQLAFWMNVQATCARANSPIARGARDIGGVILAGITVVAPPSAALTVPAGLVLTMAQINIEMCENTLPSRLTGMNLLAQPRDFNEDDAGPGSWSASLMAQADNWTLDWPTVIGLVPGVGSFGKFVGKAMKQTNQVIAHGAAFSEWMQTTMTTVWNHDSGPLTLEGIKVDPILVDPRQPDVKAYFDWRLEAADSPQPFEFTTDETGYLPMAEGTSLLVVETEPAAFQGQYVRADEVLRVHPIDVQIREWGTGDTSPFFVEPGEMLPLRAIVQNTTDIRVEWTADAGHLENIVDTPDEQLADYRAPMDGGTYRVTATSLASGGARDNPGAPERYDTALVIVGSLRLAPQPSCMEIGDSVRFHVTMGGQPVDPNEVVWMMGSGSPGTLDGDGTFHATHEGQVNIEVYHVDNVDLTATVSFGVNEECGGFRVSTVGDASFSFEGMCMVSFNNTVYMTDGAGNRVEFHIPRDVVDDLEEGIVETAVLDININVEYPSIPPVVWNLWSSIFNEGAPGTLTLWGYWAEYDFYIPEIGETITDEVFFLSGAFEGPLTAVGFGNDGVFNTYVTGEFRGVSDGWGRSRSYWGHRMDEVCEDAGPLGGI